MNATTSTNATNHQAGKDARLPGHMEPGGSTALSLNLHYRLGKLRERGLLKGRWLDCGCADGGYTTALAAWGVEQAIGIASSAARDWRS